MKLSPRTLNLFKNFSTVNPNILVKPGSMLETVNAGHNILAYAEITEEFPKQFGIYDLSQFLGAMSLLEEPDLEFGERYVTLAGKNASIRFFYSSPEMLTVPGEKKIEHLPNVDVAFKLKSSQLSEVLRSASVLQLPEVVAMSSGEDIFFAAIDTKNNTSNHYSTKVGENSGVSFKMIFKTENLKMIPVDYDVEICAKGIAKFAATEGGKITYFVAVEAHSEFNGASRS